LIASKGFVDVVDFDWCSIWYGKECQIIYCCLRRDV